jgi:hypothetical protein
MGCNGSDPRFDYSTPGTYRYDEPFIRTDEPKGIYRPGGCVVNEQPGQHGGCIRDEDDPTLMLGATSIANMNVWSAQTSPVTMASQAMVGAGGAPMRASTFPTDAVGRKQRPVASGVLDYFPDALIAISEVSWQGNQQHNPGKPLHWDRAKSGDESDALMRHFLQRGLLDSDGVRHSAKLAWRALALLQKEIEQTRI